MPWTILVAVSIILSLLDQGISLKPHTRQIGITHGVAPTANSHYSSAVGGGSFHCLDGSLELPGAFVNDDFCDCGDGSDEPGTAACAGTAGAYFYCKNVQSVSKLIPTSRVRDGICDCCDGSDERGHHSQCVDACEAEGANLRDELEQKRKQILEGIRLRKTIEAETDQRIRLWRSEEAQLDKDIASMEKQRNESRRLWNNSNSSAQAAEKVVDPTERIVFEEDFERAGLKKRWRIRKDGGATIDIDRQRGKVLAMNSCTWGGDAFSRAGFTCSPGAECRISFWAKGAPWQGFSRGTKRTTDELVDAHSWLAVPKKVEDYPDRLVMTDISSNWSYYEYEFPAEDHFQMLGSEEVRFSNSEIHIMLQAHSSTGQCASTMFDDFRVVSLVQAAAKQSVADPMVKNRPLATKELEKDKPAVSEYAKWAVGMDAVGSRENLHEPNIPESELNISAESIGLDVEVPHAHAPGVDDEAANQTQAHLNALEKNFRTAKTKRASLASKLKHVEGVDGLRWAPLIDRCVSALVNEYNYSICFFTRAKQGSVNLGNFHGWDPQDGQVMIFAHGHRCHGGPARSLKAHLVCGESDELIDISEPSRCNYKAEVATPCACGEEGLVLLDEQTKSMFGTTMRKHTEL